MQHSIYTYLHVIYVCIVIVHVQCFSSTAFFVFLCTCAAIRLPVLGGCLKSLVCMYTYTYSQGSSSRSPLLTMTRGLVGRSSAGFLLIVGVLAIFSTFDVMKIGIVFSNKQTNWLHFGPVGVEWPTPPPPPARVPACRQWPGHTVR